MHAPSLNNSSALTSFPKVGSSLYKSFLRNLVQHRSPACLIEKKASRSETEIAEGVIVKAFSNELIKLGFGEQFVMPILKMVAPELLYQLGTEGVGRFLGTSHRSPTDLLKDTAVGTVTHGVAKGIGNYAGPGIVQNTMKMMDPWGWGIKSRLGWDAVGGGIKMLAGGVNKKQPAGLGKPDQLTAATPTDPTKAQMGNSNAGPGQLSYSQLRRMDPSVISSQYFS